jgi:hypothetical protein
VRSSAIFLVRVVTSTRSPADALVDLAIRSSIWPLVGLTIDLGVDEPGGPDDLLDDPPDCVPLVGPGVADR